MYICVGPRYQPLSRGEGHCLVSEQGPCRGFVKRGCSKERFGRLPNSPQSALCFQRELRGQTLSVERVHSYLFIMSIKPWGALDLGLGSPDPRGCRRSGGRVEASPSPLLCFSRVGGLSLRASGSHSHTPCGPHLRCKAHCASRKSHRLSVGN